MTPDWRALLLLIAPALLGMRDPFRPPEDKCQSAQLSQWRYRGAVGRVESLTGFLVDASGKWLRTTQGQHLINGWVVYRLTPAWMDITLGEQCEPQHWRWMNEGAKHGLQQVSGSTIAYSIGDGKGTTDHADGR